MNKTIITTKEIKDQTGELPVIPIGTIMKFVSDEGPDCGYIIAALPDKDYSTAVMYGEFEYVVIGWFYELDETDKQTGTLLRFTEWQIAKPMPGIEGWEVGDFYAFPMSEDQAAKLEDQCNEEK